MNHNFLSSSRLKKLKLKSYGKKIQISPNVTIIGSDNIQMGDNVRIDDYTIISSSFFVILSCMLRKREKRARRLV